MKILLILFSLLSIESKAQLFDKAFADSLNKYEWMDNKNEKTKILLTLSSKKIISPFTLCYFEKTLRQAPTNSILFTNGELDTYSIWLIQETKKIRTDVKVVRLRDVMNNKYTHGPMAIQATRLSTIIQRLKKDYTNILFSVTIEPSSLSSVKRDLYLIGTVYKHSSITINNISVLQKNMSQLCVIEEEISDDSPLSVQGKKLEQNYLPGLILLHRFYKKNMDSVQANTYNMKARSIASKHQLLKEVEKQLSAE